MPVRTENMQQVVDMGDVLPEGWYRVRCKSATIEDSKNTPGEQTLKMVLLAQDEPFTGRALTDFVSLQSHALSKLKAYYKAIGYTPGPEGHDTDKVINGEFFVKAEHEVYKGQTRAKIAPWNVRSLNEGPGN